MENILFQHRWSPSRLPEITLSAPSQASARRFSTSLKVLYSNSVSCGLFLGTTLRGFPVFHPDLEVWFLLLINLKRVDRSVKRNISSPYRTIVP